MIAFLAPVLSFLLLYKYWAVFVVMFFSALIVPLPTNTVLLAAGAFASQGYFNFPITLIVAVGSNVLGDYAGYLLARRYGHRALRMLRVKIPPSMENLDRFIGRHPGPAIFLTRFVGTADSLANLLAGFIAMPIRKFLIYDGFGNLVSTGAVLYVGYVLGTDWQDFSGLFSIAGWIFLGVIVIAILFSIMWYRHRTAPPPPDVS